MPAQLQDVNDLKSYLNGVINRAEHHAPNVKQICLALAGAVVLYKDSDRPLEVRGTRGDFKNVLWAYIKGNRYAFSYSHQGQAIEIRRGSIKGQPTASFNNQTPISEILRTGCYQD